MVQAIQAIVDGILTGALYALVGIGMALIFGVMRIVNFAHGAFLMVGMYVTFLIFRHTGLNPYYAFILSGLILFLLGYATYKTLLQPIRERSEFMQILLTSGIGLILIGGAQTIFGSNFHQLNLPLLTKYFHFGPITVSAPSLLTFVITAALIVLLYLFVMRTFTGYAVRAIAQNSASAPLVGINVNRIQALSFAVGTAAAGISGALLWPVLYFNPTVGEEFTLKAFVVVVLGGMGSIAGAAMGGLVLGIVESLTTRYWGQQWAAVVDFIIFLLVLSIRPGGIFGKHRA